MALRPRTFSAKYEGRCRSCQEPIEVDDDIGYDDNDDIVCAECLGSGGFTPRAAPRPVPTCSVCGTQHPGEC